jgi:hemerythrin-like domain-containing protein
LLLPAFARYGDPAAAPVVRLLVEHVQIRRLVADLQHETDAGHPAGPTMQAIGELLRAHIRHEEDVVFPLIEQAMPEEALVALAGQLAAAAPAVESTG